jgi:hypothetical protein
MPEADRALFQKAASGFHMSMKGMGLISPGMPRPQSRNAPSAC